MLILALTFGQNSALAGSLSWARIRALSRSDQFSMHIDNALECSFQRIPLKFLYVQSIKSYPQLKSKIVVCRAKYAA